MSKQVSAAFGTGDTVEYIGDRQRWDENKKPLFERGMCFQIIETVQPSKGIGYFIDGDGDQMFDGDKDGYNVYKLGNGQRTIIWPKDSAQWIRK